MINIIFMSDYPSSIYNPRTKENKPGVVYTPAKTTVGYAEDISLLDSEVVALENELGLDPKGSSNSIAERIKGIRSLSNAIADLITINDNKVGIGTTSPSNLLEVANPTGSSDIRLTSDIGYTTISSRTEFDLQHHKTTAGNATMDFQGFPISPGATQYRFGLQSGSTGSNNIILFKPNSTSAFASIGTSGVVFNEGGDDADFRVEGDTDVNLFKIDAGNNRVGIGTWKPSSLFHVSNLGNAGIPTKITIGNDYTGLWDLNDIISEISFRSEDTSGSGPQEKAKIQIINDHSGGTTMSGAIGLWTSNFNAGATEKVRVTSVGNVGIGITDPHSKLEVNGAISSSTMTITASADNTNVAGVNTLFINTLEEGDDVIIGGLSGGVEGQVLYITMTNAAKSLTLEHLEGVGDQDLVMHDASDETIDDWGGFTLICDGTKWYDCSHAKHV